MEINEDDVIRMLLGLPKGKQVEHPLWTEAEASQPEVFIYHLSPGKKHGRGLLDSAGEARPHVSDLCTCYDSCGGCQRPAKGLLR